MPPERLRELILQTSKDRLVVCRDCEFNSENKRTSNTPFDSSWRKDEHCTVCSCPLITKTKALHAKCPLNPPKWDRVATDSESLEINNAIKDVEERTS